MKNVRTLAQALVRIFVRPVFPFLQWATMSSGLVGGPHVVEGPHARQRFRIGFLRPGMRPEDALREAQRNGFFPNRIAYTDPGQCYSLRRLDEMDPRFQYHLRIFRDGEVRGHFEYTPEDRPIAHMREDVFEARTENFAAWLRETVDSTLPKPPAQE